MHHKRLVRPVFLLCSERSGSNLIARIFGSHPEFYAPSPAHLFRVMAPLGPASANQTDLLRLFRAKLGVWKLDALSDAELNALLKGSSDIPDMICTLLLAEGERRGKPRLFLKENSPHDFLPMMENVSEAPGYLHMLRDPRDMAVSWIKAPTLRGGVVRAARRWLSDAQGALDVEAEGRIMARLTYEALLQDPEGSLRSACEALELPFSATMLEHVSQSDSVQQDAGRTALWKNLSKDIMRDNFNKFQGQLSDDEIAYVEALCGPLMDRFGYRRSRADTAPKFGSHESFAALEAHLEAREPWTKPAYGDLPKDERARLEAWSALREELMEKHARA